jgi:hypothetical protein
MRRERERSYQKGEGVQKIGNTVSKKFWKFIRKFIRQDVYKKWK